LSCGKSLYIKHTVICAENPTAGSGTNINRKNSTSTFSCPKCSSKNLTGNKKGFGFGKAIIGGVLAGGIGLLGGFIGSQKVIVTCMECGYSWEAGKK
jgi:tellurium resistance protein TerD